MECAGVSYRYPGFQNAPLVVRNASFLLREGQFVCLLGANGSGKSTLAKLCAGLLRPSAGRVIIGAWNTNEAHHGREIRQAVGIVFQNPDNQLVAATVAEDVAFGPQNFGLPIAEIEARVAGAMAAVGIADLAERATHSLSGGQKQLVAMAGALAMQPKLLILDEPAAMLDPAGRQAVLDAVRTVNRQGLAVLLLTPNLGEALAADRILLMRDGELIEINNRLDLAADFSQLIAHGIIIPPILRLAASLRAKGLPIPNNITDVDGLVEAICRLISRK